MSIEIAYLSDRTPAECYVYNRWQLGLSYVRETYLVPTRTLL